MSKKRSFITCFTLVLVLGFFQLLYSGISNAATHYVSPTGSDTWANSTNIDTPCSATTAMSNAVAGDIVYFRGGTYNLGISPTDSYQNILQPSNSGVAGNSITFQAYTGETPILVGIWRSAAYKQAMIIGVYQKSYVVIDGFTLYGEDGSSNPVCASSRIVNASYVTIKNCKIRGVDTVDWTDNVEGIRIEGSNHITVQRNYIYDFKNSSGNHNTSAIKTYDNSFLTIENNELVDNNASGIYLKRSTSDSVVRYNFIRCPSGACNGGSIFSNPGGAASTNDYRIKIYHNLVIHAKYGIFLLSAGGNVAEDFEVYNNTVYYSSGSGENTAITCGNGSTWKIYNNIVQGYGTGRKLLWYPSTVVGECQYNQYGSATFKVVTNLYGGGGTRTYNSLTDWHNSTEVYGNVHPEGAITLNGLASDPKFVNGSGNLNQLYDFRLASDSPCKGTGKGGLDMGANIDFMGVSGRPPEDNSPAPPKGLKIMQ